MYDPNLFSARRDRGRSFKVLYLSISSDVISKCTFPTPYKIIQAIERFMSRQKENTYLLAQPIRRFFGLPFFSREHSKFPLRVNLLEQIPNSYFNQRRFLYLI